jgi:hypothetical protein
VPPFRLGRSQDIFTDVDTVEVTALAILEGIEAGVTSIV